MIAEERALARNRTRERLGQKAIPLETSRTRRLALALDQAKAVADRESSAALDVLEAGWAGMGTRVEWNRTNM